jgi:aminoglycoside 6'-N-acetyltransferase
MTKKMQKVTLRSFEPEQDKKMVKEWLESPHVKKWWGDPEEELKLILEAPDQEGQYIILADDQAVGYLQWQKVTRSELDVAGLTEIPEGAIDIDIAIGKAENMGKNLGSRALKHLIKTVLLEVPAPMIMICTSMDNFQAQKAFEKAGFVKQRTFADPLYGRMIFYKYGNEEASL